MMLQAASHLNQEHMTKSELRIQGDGITAWEDAKIHLPYIVANRVGDMN